MSNKLKVRELKKLTKNELVAEILVMEEAFDGLWAIKERYKKRLKDAGVWEKTSTKLESTNSLNVSINRYGGIVKIPS